MERPIIFSAPMVRALLAGRKTQTRRRVKPGRAPYGRAGDTLWVREGFARVGEGFFYRADARAGEPEPIVKWRSPLHMPRVACRIVLRVEAVRTERLQSISEADARAEGVESRAVYALLWDALNAAHAPWADDPEVWVVTFSVERA